MFPAVQRAGLAGLALLCGALHLFSAQAATLVLLSQAEVDAQGIFLDQIATGPADVLNNVYLDAAPKWGETLILSQTKLKELLAKSGVARLSQMTLAGASEIRITRKSRKLESRELLELLTEKLKPQFDRSGEADLDLSFTREWKPLPVPIEPIDVRLVDSPGAGLSARSTIRFEILAGEAPEQEVIGIYPAFLQAHVYRNVWVARSVIRRGTNLEVAELAVERRDVVGIKEQIWSGDDGLGLGELRAVDTIPAGGVVLARAIQRRPVINRGDMVLGVMREGSINIRLMVQALEDGAPDQFIRTRNPRTKKEIRGKVINEETIELYF